MNVILKEDDTNPIKNKIKSIYKKLIIYIYTSIDEINGINRKQRELCIEKRPIFFVFLSEPACVCMEFP